MSENPSKQFYEAAIKELSDLDAELKALEQRRDVLKSRMTELKRGVVAVAPLCDEPPPWETYPNLFQEQRGLSEAVRKVLTKIAAGAWISPVTIRDQLKNVGYESQSENILPSIHNVLKRFLDAGDIERKDRGRGKKWYRWKDKLAPGESVFEDSELKKNEK